jgi:hypothetical protein
MTPPRTNAATVAGVRKSGMRFQPQQRYAAEQQQTHVERFRGE